MGLEGPMNRLDLLQLHRVELIALRNYTSFPTHGAEPETRNEHSLETHRLSPHVWAVVAQWIRSWRVCLCV
jgi:hypothetical protein